MLATIYLSTREIPLLEKREIGFCINGPSRRIQEGI